MKTVLDNLKLAEKRLHKAKIGTTRLDCELLLAEVLKRDRGWLLAHDDQTVTQTQQKRFDSFIERRIDHEPLAYIVGRKEFFGLDFHVNQSVLIPRVETEVMVEQIIGQQKSKKQLRILDVGTGCGAIAIALAYHLPSADVTATDISTSALRVARQNAKTHQVNSRLEFIQSDLLDSVNDKYDVIAANLPYVPLKIKDRLEPDLDFEPKVALYGGEDGLDIYQRFFATVDRYLVPKGQIWCEADPWQHSHLTALARKSGLRIVFEDYLIMGFSR